MALYQEGERRRPSDRFAEIAGRVTRRPSSHTDRADVHGLERVRHPLRGKVRNPAHDYPETDEVEVMSHRIAHEEDNRMVRVRLPQPRPEVPELRQIEEQLAAVEETIVLDFSRDTDQQEVRRPDVFEDVKRSGELTFAPLAAPEEVGVFVRREAKEMPVFAKPVRKRDGSVHRTVNGSRIRAKQFLTEIGEVGSEALSPKKLSRLLGRVNSAIKNSSRSPRYPSRVGA